VASVAVAVGLLFFFFISKLGEKGKGLHHNKIENGWGAQITTLIQPNNGAANQTNRREWVNKLTRPIKRTKAATLGCHKHKKFRKETFRNSWLKSNTPAPKKVVTEKPGHQPITIKTNIKYPEAENSTNNNSKKVGR
jgi:hypothetical protein